MTPRIPPPDQMYLLALARARRILDGIERANVTPELPQNRCGGTEPYCSAGRESAGRK